MVNRLLTIARGPRSRIECGVGLKLGGTGGMNVS